VIRNFVIRNFNVVPKKNRAASANLKLSKFQMIEVQPWGQTHVKNWPLCHLALISEKIDSSLLFLFVSEKIYSSPLFLFVSIPLCFRIRSSKRLYPDFLVLARAGTILGVSVSVTR
jgi:hypothetical protein